MNDSNLIENVSDTALWVATFRADEGKRPDAAFHDPLSGVLAGDRGQRIAKQMAFRDIMSWIMVMRTVGIDRLIMKAVAEGVDTVLNLGAGLDTRPYRMPLPADLRWVEVDFYNIIQLKDDKLKAQRPVCRLERIALDLAQDRARRDLLMDIGAKSQKLLVITEGVIPYLCNDDVAKLSNDLAAVPTMWGWIQDFNNDLSARKRRPRGWSRKMRMAPFLFSVANWHEFFISLGWRIVAESSAMDEAMRLKRPFPRLFPFGFLLALMPRQRAKFFRRMSGQVLYRRS